MLVERFELWLCMRRLMRSRLCEGERGPTEHNKMLSQERSKVVSEFLKAQGLAPAAGCVSCGQPSISKEQR